MKNLKAKRASVIAIENNYIDMLVLKALLGKYVNLCIAPDIELAEKIISEFNFDMILLDVNSCNTKKANLNTIKAKSTNKDIKVCGLANKFEGTDVFTKEVFNDILTKPVCKEDIFKVLNWEVIETPNFLLSNSLVLRTLSSVF